MKKHYILAGVAGLVLSGAFFAGNAVLARCDGAEKDVARVAATKDSGCAAKKAAMMANAEGKTGCSAAKASAASAASGCSAGCGSATATPAMASRTVHPFSNGVILVYNSAGCDKARAGVRTAAQHGCKASCGLDKAGYDVQKASADSGCPMAARARLEAAAKSGCDKSKATLAALDKYEDPQARAELKASAAKGCTKSKATLATLAEYGMVDTAEAGKSGCSAKKAAMVAKADGESGCCAGKKAEKAGMMAKADGESGCAGKKAGMMAKADGGSGCCAGKTADKAAMMAKADGAAGCAAKAEGGCGDGCLMSLVKEMRGVEMERIETANGAILIVTSKRDRNVDTLHEWAAQVNGDVEGETRTERASL